MVVHSNGLSGRRWLRAGFWRAGCRLTRRAHGTGTQRGDDRGAGSRSSATVPFAWRGADRMMGSVNEVQHRVTRVSMQVQKV